MGVVAIGVMVASMNSSPKACEQSGAISLAASGSAVEAVWALGNVVGDSPKCCDLVLSCGALIPLLAQFNEHAKLSMCAQERVFTPFMQADNSTSRNYGGTGIGLSISKCLVELMVGQINFISRPQIGSTFSFTAVFKRCQKIATGDMKKSLSGDLPTTFICGTIYEHN